MFYYHEAEYTLNDLQKEGRFGKVSRYSNITHVQNSSTLSSRHALRLLASRAPDHLTSI